MVMVKVMEMAMAMVMEMVLVMVIAKVMEMVMALIQIRHLCNMFSVSPTTAVVTITPPT